MPVSDIKKFFTKNSSINFLNDFTLQDVEDAKKSIYMKYYKKEGESFKSSLDKAAEKLIKEKFYAGIKEDQGVAVKNTVRDVLNANYKNTITKLIMVDSQYRTQLSENETNFIVQFNEKVVNAVSLEMMNIQIPYTFYNVEARQGNDHFILTTVTKDVNGVTKDANGVPVAPNKEIKLDDGHYKKLEDLIINLNLQVSRYGLLFAIDPITKKCKLTNTSTNQYKLTFLTSKNKINHCLGWYLGFRNFQGSNVANKYITLEYDLPLRVSSTEPSFITGSTVATIPHPKYFVIVIDDFNNNQTADTMVQININPENTKPTSYFTQDPLLDSLLPDNLDNYLANVPNRTLTKSQLYTIAQQNLEKQNLYFQNTRLEVHAPNQVLGIIPFEESKCEWGAMVFTDKNKYTREYHSPTNLDRIHVKIYDDKGYPLNLNGNNWCMTLLTNNLYKY